MYIGKVTDSNENLLVQESYFSNDLSFANTDKKKNMANKLHRQFSHPTAEKLISLLKDADIIDEELFKLIIDLTSKCEICLKYKKPKPRPVVGFPIARVFNETVALDLKEWSSNTLFLHMIFGLTPHRLLLFILHLRTC